MSLLRYIVSFHGIESYLNRPTTGMVLYLNKKNSNTFYLEKEAKGKGVRVVWIEGEFQLPIQARRGLKGAVLEVPPTEGRVKSIEELTVNAKEASCVVLLDGITDVHNLGAIIRTADLFTVDGIVIPKHRSARKSDSVDRTSAGASAFVPIVEVPNLVRAIEFLKEKGYWIYGAEGKGVHIHEVDFQRKVCLVMGSEDRGLGRLVKENCDLLVGIPMGGHVGSFNVSVAAGILLYEIRKKQGLLDSF